MKFRWFDALIILGVIIITIITAIVIYTNPSDEPSETESKYMLVRKENEEIYKLNLSELEEAIEIEIEGVSTTMTIAADSDGCYVLYSGCPDQTCVNRGKIIDSGDISIICLPNEVEISIIYE